MAEQEEVTAEFMDSLERRVEDLRNQFEQYFLGSRRTAPLQDRTTIQYAIRKVANYTIPNLRLRFRYQQLVAKFNSYNNYWNRTLTQIEEGRYSRDRFKMKLHTGALEASKDTAKDKAKDGAKEEGKPEPAAAKAKAAKPAASGLPDDHIDQVHRDFVAAKKQLNQDASISREKIAETIKKQLPELQKRYQGKDIRFKVVIEDGKAKLKATVK